MNFIRKVNITEYDYELPEERIAQYPVDPRDFSKLLLYNKGIISEDIFRNIDRHIPADSLLVFNNTRVIRARLLFRKSTGAGIEIFCIEPLYPADYEQSFSSTGPVEWKCIIGNLKKWKEGSLFLRFPYKGQNIVLGARKLGEQSEAWRIQFSWDHQNVTFGEIIKTAGHIPLPPYVHRNDESEDNVRYQTVYSKVDGSVAAPTAGLHFTNEVLENIRKKGIRRADLTLHVGAGTFQPVRSEDLSRHEMHCEHFLFTRELVEELAHYRGKVIAAGTTSVRTLESIYWLGALIKRKKIKTGDNLYVGQWDPYYEDGKVTPDESFENILELFERQGKKYLNANTKIMIAPGYRFMVTDGMITNFHQPRSTLLLLVAAWIGNEWKRIYSYALENSFRFLSFGDGSLLLRQ